MTRDRFSATLSRARTVCELAASTAEYRMERKCAALAIDVLSHDGRDDAAAWAFAAEPMRALEQSGRCEALYDVGAVYAQARRKSESATRFAACARKCRSPAAALRAAAQFTDLQRCPDALAIIQETFPFAETDEQQVGLLDGVTRCSDAYSVSKNMAFVPRAVRRRYAALLEAREAERRAAEERERLARAEAAQREAASAARSACASDCSTGGSQCRASCVEGSCISRCEAAESMCRSGCH